MLKEDLHAAIEHGSETEAVDYKESFNPESQADWLEIIKDIVAFANSGGGAIIIGITDAGTLSGFDCSALPRIDPADVTNKVFSYTGLHFSGFEFVTIPQGADTLFAMLVRGVDVPMVFSKPGTYDIGGGKQKTAFSKGTVYFRHGAKSEPGNSDDLRVFLERRVEEIRKSWLEGIVKVVEAPPGSRIEVVTPSGAGAGPGSPMRLVNDPNAPAYNQIPIDQTHPFRQKEVVEEVNKALGGSTVVKPFHIQCVRQAHQIEKEPTLCYIQKYSSARYSQAFVDWIVEEYKADPAFFEVAKQKMDQLKQNGSAS